MRKITPFLWFDTQAEEAMNHYLRIFKSGKVLGVMRQGGKVLTCQFEIEGQELIALNGGPHHRLTEAFSLVVNCATQAEIDDLWEKLIAGGGEPGPCGWLKDRFGLSWQVVPSGLGSLLASPKAMQAMLKMSKLDIAALERAAAS